MPKLGFSLAEVLISVMILSIISIFSIPKIIRAQRDNSYNAMAKETIGTISQEYLLYKLNNIVNANTKSTDLIQRLNFVKVQTTGLIDHVPGNTSTDCGATVFFTCWKLHNGAILSTSTGNTFGVANNQHYVYYHFDPDGVYSGSTTGQGKSLVLRLYYNGRITTSTEHKAGDDSYNFGVPQGWTTDPMPNWYSW